MVVKFNKQTQALFLLDEHSGKKLFMIWIVQNLIKGSSDKNNKIARSNLWIICVGFNRFYT